MDKVVNYLDVLRRIQSYLEFTDKVVNSQLQSKLEYILRGEADDRVSVQVTIMT